MIESQNENQKKEYYNFDYFARISFILFLIVFYMISCKEDILKDENQEPVNKSGITLNIPLSGSLQNPAFSPDGEWIVFTRFLNGYNREPAEIYKYNLSTKDLVLLVSDGSGNINLPGSCWNDKIKSIVFSSSREPHDEIYLIKENGRPGDESRITFRENKVAYEPSINPDGKRIVFESHNLDEEDNGIITIYNIDKSSPYVYITKETEDCRQPNWSPKEDKIVYQRYENGQWDLWVINSDGLNNHKITDGTGDKTDPSFSPDGRFIIYSSDFESDFANIYKIPINGGSPVRLTNYTGYEGAPSFSPKGDKIIFESSEGAPENSGGTKLVILEL